MKTPQVSSLCLLVPALIAASTLNAPAAAYLKFDTVDGDATAPGHVGEIDVLCFNHSLSRSNTAVLPALSEFTVTKSLDKASPKLAEACAAGQPLAMCVLSARKAGSTTTNDYYVVALENVFITSYRAGASCGSGSDQIPTETISMSYTRIIWTYEPQDTNGVPTGSKIIGRWPAGPPPP